MKLVKSLLLGPPRVSSRSPGHRPLIFPRGRRHLWTTFGFVASTPGLLATSPAPTFASSSVARLRPTTNGTSREPIPSGLWDDTVPRRYGRSSATDWALLRTFVQIDIVGRTGARGSLGHSIVKDRRRVPAPVGGFSSFSGTNSISTNTGIELSRSVNPTAVHSVGRVDCGRFAIVLRLLMPDNDNYHGMGDRTRQRRLANLRLLATASRRPSPWQIGTEHHVVAGQENL